MNVSSVKNLNGETFSAVQDADLTTVVQTNSSNWNDISAYQNASGTYLTAHQSLADYATTADLALKQDTLTFDYDEQNKISAINNSALAGGSNFSGITYTGSYIDGNEETVNYTAVATGIGTDYDGVIGTLKFTSGNNSNINKYLMAKRLATNTIASGTLYSQPYKMSINPANTPFTYKTGIFAPLTYATGACLTYGSTGSPGWSVDTATNQYYGAFFKGNEIFISNAMIDTNQALRLETHNGRGVHISGTNMRSSGYFDVSVNGLKIGAYNSYTSSWVTWNFNRSAYDRWNEVSSKLNNSALEYNELGEISGIAGSAIAGGGGGNPEVENYVQTNSGTIDDTVTAFQTNSSTYMVEPNLEYNAVNEISAYNGSAIAQYGAEKQWLVHDDTLVHAANSAQYALGCNISALQRLMGIDETVLFFAGNESSGVQSGNLTESIKNFKRIRVAGMDNDGHTDVKYIYPAWTKNADGFSTSGYEVMLYGATPYAPQSTIWEKWTRYSFSALTSFNIVLSYEGSYTANSVNNVTNNHKNSIREVVGIGRIIG